MNDVCIVLEGTYPKVTGGVATWVHDLTNGLMEVGFDVVRLINGEEPPGAPRYEPPANVRMLELSVDPDRPGRVEGEVPPARVYHAASTGISGAVAAHTAQTVGAPLIVTEHGLAWREAALPFTAGSHHFRPPFPGSESRREWVDLNLRLARDAYATATAVVGVCEENAGAQRALGARPRVIENAARAQPTVRVGDGVPRVGLIARVTPVKDVLGFVRACALVARELPNAEFVVIGPLDHDERYAERCIELTRKLGLNHCLQFTGEMNPRSWYPRLDVVALTSVSEAQPLALLEAMGAGIPVVATDVGGCRRLVEGSGRVVAPGSPHASAEAIVGLLRDPAARRRLGAAGQRRVRSRHSHSRLLASYQQLYAQVT
jgi:polysaccharide biosynthesis protein PelF